MPGLFPSIFRGAVQWPSVMIPSCGNVGAFMNVGRPEMFPRSIAAGIAPKSASHNAR